MVMYFFTWIQNKVSTRILEKSIDVAGMVGPPLCKCWGATQPKNHLLQQDLIENCLRGQGLLLQTMPGNWELGAAV